MLLSRPFLNGPARLNGRFWKIARFFVILPVFFVILFILNTVRYAQTKDEETPTMKRTTKNTSARFFPKMLISPAYCPFFLLKKRPFFARFFWEKAPYEELATLPVGS